MDFLLECVGFPPGYELAELERTVRARAESVAWRGPRGLHLRYPLGGGLEVRLDQEEHGAPVTLLPYFEAGRRLRVAVEGIERPVDSPFDAHLIGRANPPVPGDPWNELGGEGYTLSCFVTDARRLPRALPPRHVLAVDVSGFAIDVSYLGPNDGLGDPEVLEAPQGARLTPLTGTDAPYGCMELSLRIRKLRRLENGLTGEPLLALETDAPGRPLELFVSRWQLEAEGLGVPRPGWRIEGAFLITGRIAGGLPRAGTNGRRRSG